VHARSLCIHVFVYLCLSVSLSIYPSISRALFIDFRSMSFVYVSLSVSLDLRLSISLHTLSIYHRITYASACALSLSPSHLSSFPLVYLAPWTNQILYRMTWQNLSTIPHTMSELCDTMNESCGVYEGVMSHISYDVAESFTVCGII